MLAQTGVFSISFAANPVELFFFRAGLNRWLIGQHWPEPDRIDAVLAVSEACDNCVRHAYSAGDEGVVEVTARVTIGSAGRRIVVSVRDGGQRQGGWTGHGFGLTTMHECMDQVRIRRGRAGATVIMTSRPVPLLEDAAKGDGLQD